MTVRILTMDDAEALRDFRLLSLRTTPEFFTTDAERERRRTLLRWAAVARETSNHAIFAGFSEDGNLVCMGGAKRFAGDPSGATAYWHSDFMPANRCNPIVFARMQQLRTRWCLSYSMATAVFTIHHANARALATYVRDGTEVFKSEPRRFADGNIAVALWCRRELRVG